MRFLRYITLLFLFLTIRPASNAQLPDSIPARDDVAGEILVKVYRTKIPSAIELALDFQILWDGGGLTASQQSQIDTIYSTLESRQLSTVPYLLYILKTVTNAGGNELVQISALEQILDVSLKVLQNHNRGEIRDFFRNINSFLTHKAIHYSNGYKLLAGNIDFTFEYVEGDDFMAEEIPEEPVAVDNQPGELQPEDAETSGDWSDDWDSSGDNWASDDNREEDPDPWAEGSDPWAENTDDWGNSSGNRDDEGNAGTGPENDPWGEIPMNNLSAENSPEDDQAMIDAIIDEPLPPEEGPLIRFNTIDLTFQTHYDSVTLRTTSGAFLLINEQFIGEGGIFDWATLGIDPGKVYCELGKFALNTNNSEIYAVRSMLTYNEKIDKPVEGSFFYRSIPRRDGEKSTYPRFTSYDHSIRVYYPVDKDLIFKGGFSLVGEKIISKSLLRKISELSVRHESGYYFRAYSPQFTLGDSIITSEKAEITIYHNRDSIYHPAVRLDYNPNNRELMIRRDNGTYRITPYTASYFNMDIYSDRIRWDLDEDSIDISISSAQNIVSSYFESADYFNKKDMKSLAGMYSFNPLIMTVYYARKIKSKHFNVYDMASRMGQNDTEVKSAMIALMQNKFIDYNQNTGDIMVRDKAFHYVDANRFRKDYDDLKIKSLSPLKPNATIDIADEEMTIRGISRFYISEILDVYIMPGDNEITVKRDRDLKFNGQLFAGNFEFIGREFLFNYDSFFVDLNTIDSIRFYIDDLETGGKRRVDNKLVSATDSSARETMDGLAKEFDGSTGRLFINRPDNKSGQKIYPEYPRFDAEQGAIVYFDNHEVLDGAYDKSIYFVIPPFQIDSLSGSDPAAIGFDGVFVAEGILPQFEETLHIMEDNSLGFEHTIAPEGYQLYDGEGRIYDNLKLDQNGLTTTGSVNYLTSTLKSEQFTFFMDSLTGEGTSFTMRKGEYERGSFPDAWVENFRLKWLPAKDSMYIRNLEDPFSLYDNTATLDGMYVVNRQGGFGNGTLLTRGAVAQSNQFSFNETRFGARHARFEIKSNNPEKPALSGEDIRLNFNLSQNYADIGPEIEGMAAINFPFAQFKTSISNARWNLDDRTVVMTKPDGVDISNTYFYATREELDSLAFNASEAVYDIDKLELLISGIPYIKVADAKITPENNEVLVLENARIGTLYNTTIVIDTVNEYHKLYDGTIDILSRNEFEGNATYQFVNAVNDTFAIKIDEFLLVADDEKGGDKKMHTKAMGYVFEQDGVVISPGMIYKGEAIMYAPDPAFELNGFVKLEYNPDPENDIWIRYQSSETETQQVVIDFNKARTEDEEPLIAGIHYDNADRLYATYVGDKKSVMDQDFFTAGGMLSYEADSGIYLIEDTLKITGQSYSGKIYNLKVNSGDLEFEGPVDFNLISDDFEIEAAGIGSGNIKGNEYRMNSFITMDFDLPSQAINSMGLHMLETVDFLGLPVAYGNDPKTLYKLSEIIGERATLDFEEQSLQEYVPLVSISQRLLKTLILSDIDLVWSKEHKAWYSTGEIGISNVMRDDINAMAQGFVEIKKNETGDIINVFLQLSPNCWYFFNFEENRIITSSSNEEYLEIIADKTDALRANFGEYFYLDGEFSDAMRFVDRFRAEYLGITEPYEIDYAPAQKTIPILPQEEPADDGFAIPEEIEEEEETDDGF